MTKWEYEITTCAPEEIFDILNLKGSQGWEFVTLLMMQKLIENKFAVGQPPRTVMEFQLIFKRQSYEWNSEYMYWEKRLWENNLLKTDVEQPS